MNKINRLKKIFLLFVSLSIIFIISFAGGGGDGGSSGSSKGGSGGGKGGSGSTPTLNPGDWIEVTLTENWSTASSYLYAPNTPNRITYVNANAAPQGYGGNTCPNDNYPAFSPSNTISKQIIVQDLDALNSSKIICPTSGNKIQIPYNHRYAINAICKDCCTRVGGNNNLFYYVRIQWKADVKKFEGYEQAPTIYYQYDTQLSCP